MNQIAQQISKQTQYDSFLKLSVDGAAQISRMRTTSTGQANRQGSWRALSDRLRRHEKRFSKTFEIKFQKGVDNENETRRMRVPLQGETKQNVL